MGLVEAWGETAVGWFFAHLIESFYNFGYAITHPSSWLSWIGSGLAAGDATLEQKQALMRFIYYGASIEFFFFTLVVFLIMTGYGLYNRAFMWGCVRVTETFANVVGRIAAWAGLIMVLQQIAIVFLQRIFTQASINLGPVIDKDISWWAEGLKLHNAIIVCLCCTYTFVQGGHVRVDLFYAGVKYRTKRVIDMIGSLVFMVPTAVVMWLYGWFFFWRNNMTPPVSPTSKLERMELQARALKWNLETIGFSPNGFNGYFLFKVLIVILAAMIFIHAISFFYRSLLEFLDDEQVEGRYLDKDKLGDETAERAAEIH